MAERPARDTTLEARRHFDRATVAYRSGQLKQAAEHFRQAYLLAPSAELDFDLARVYERMGEAADAIRHYRSYLRHGEIVEAERRDVEKRIEELLALQTRQRAALIESPPDPTALAAEARTFFLRGTKFFRQGKYDAALIAFSEAQRFAKLPELNYNLGVTCERLNRSADAIRYYRAYLREADRPSDVEQVEARIRALEARPRTSP